MRITRNDLKFSHQFVLGFYSMFQIHRIIVTRILLIDKLLRDTFKYFGMIQRFSKQCGIGVCSVIHISNSCNQCDSDFAHRPTLNRHMRKPLNDFRTQNFLTLNVTSVVSDFAVYYMFQINSCNQCDSDFAKRRTFNSQCHIRYQVLYLLFGLRPYPPKVIQLINVVVNVISGIRSCTQYLTSVPFLPNSYD